MLFLTLKFISIKRVVKIKIIKNGADQVFPRKPIERTVFVAYRTSSIVQQLFFVNNKFKKRKKNYYYGWIG